MAATPTMAPHAGSTANRIPYSATVRARKNVGTLDAVLSIGLGTAGLVYGALRRSRGSLIAAGAGVYLVAKGVRHHDPLYAALHVSTATRAGATGYVERAVTINRPASELFAFWQDLSHLPRFIPQLVSVQGTVPGRSRWVANAPFGKTVEWDAQTTQEDVPRALAWRSLPGSQIENAGVVRFIELPHDRGTEVRVRLEYAPPAGPFGAAVAFLADEAPHEQVADALRRFKQLMETGEVATVTGQPVGRRSALMNTLHALQRAAR